jgi:hypothetical protein
VDDEDERTDFEHDPVDARQIWEMLLTSGALPSRISFSAPGLKAQRIAAAREMATTKLFDDGGRHPAMTLIKGMPTRSARKTPDDLTFSTSGNACNNERSGRGIAPPPANSWTAP